MGLLRRLLRLDKKSEDQEDPEYDIAESARDHAMTQAIRDDISSPHPLDPAIAGRRPRRRRRPKFYRSVFTKELYKDIDRVIEIKNDDKIFRFRELYYAYDYVMEGVVKAFTCSDCQLKCRGARYLSLNMSQEHIFCARCFQKFAHLRV